jgi:hypothetical protein
MLQIKIVSHENKGDDALTAFLGGLVMLALGFVVVVSILSFLT